MTLGTIIAVCLFLIAAGGLWINWQRHKREKAQERRSTTSDVWVELSDRFQSEGDHYVAIYAETGDKGGSSAHGVVIEAVIDGQPVASAEPVNLAPDEQRTVRLLVPRQFITSLQGERPIFTGDFLLRVRT